VRVRERVRERESSLFLFFAAARTAPWNIHASFRFYIFTRREHLKSVWNFGTRASFPSLPFLFVLRGPPEQTNERFSRAWNISSSLSAFIYI
jgi:hypothetical protein